MKSFIRYTMLALVLVIVAMISALTAMRFAIHGQEVVVPPLMGLTAAEAERTASGLGLQISMERQYFSPQIPEGRIMSQLPFPGTKVRRGWQVRVAESLGPLRVAIPDVTGQSEHAADLNIRRRGLDIASMAEVEAPGIPPEQVLAQSPPANATQVLAPKISLLVSAPAEPQAFVMPSYIGQPLGSASRAVQDAGFKLGNVSVAPAPAPAPAESGAEAAPPPSPTTAEPSASTPPSPAATLAQPTPASIVVAQAPAAGQKVIAGASVSFAVR
jgi:beta-lactam-binding protein with PASTA domain